MGGKFRSQESLNERIRVNIHIYVRSGEIFKQRSEGLTEIFLIWRSISPYYYCKGESRMSWNILFQPRKHSMGTLVRRNKHIDAVLQVFRNVFSHVFLHYREPEALSMSPHVNPRGNTQIPFLPCSILSPCSTLFHLSLQIHSPPFCIPALGLGHWCAPPAFFVFGWDLWLGFISGRWEGTWGWGIYSLGSPSQLPSFFSDPLHSVAQPESQGLLHLCSFRPNGDNSSLLASPQDCPNLTGFPKPCPHLCK